MCQRLPPLVSMVGVPTLACMSLRERASFYAALRFGVFFIAIEYEAPSAGADVAGLLRREAGE